MRRLFGRPRFGFGIVWLCLGVAWFLLAVLQEPTGMRLVLGSVWLLLGGSYCFLALRDMRRGHGAYGQPTRTGDVPDGPR